MKNLSLATGFLFLCGIALGQAKEGSVELQARVIPQPAVLTYLPYSPEVVKMALADYLTKTSNKDQRNANGFLLSTNTLLVRNNEGNADMNFVIDRKVQTNKNESVIYLKLNSSVDNENSWGTAPIQFDIQEAKDYLNNLAIAIKPYASSLQIKSQQKDLSEAESKNRSLVEEGNKLQKKRDKIQTQIGNNGDNKINDGLSKRKANNDRLIDENLTAQLNLKNAITKQIAALDLLMN